MLPRESPSITEVDEEPQSSVAQNTHSEVSEMTRTEAKLSLLHTMGESLREKGIDATVENDGDSGELIVEFEGHSLVISSDDIGDDPEWDEDDWEDEDEDDE